MDIGHTIGRRRACATCGKKFTDTDDLVVCDRDGDNVFCWNPNLGSHDDEGVCVQRWMVVHNFPLSYIFIGPGRASVELPLGPVLVVKRLCDAEIYFTWPPEGALVR